MSEGKTWYVACPDWHSAPKTKEVAERACAELNKTAAACDFKHYITQTPPTKE